MHTLHEHCLFIHLSHIDTKHQVGACLAYSSESQMAPYFLCRAPFLTTALHSTFSSVNNGSNVYMVPSLLVLI